MSITGSLIRVGAVGLLAVVGRANAQAVSASVAKPSHDTTGSGPLVIGPAKPGPGGSINYRPRIVYIWGPYGLVPYAPPLVVVGPGGGFPPPPPPPLVSAPRPVAPEPVAPPRPEPAPPQPARPARRNDPERAAQLVTLGDRHFRAHDLARATSRYEQAIAADPTAGAPRARLAQVAIARGQYREAALRFHEALAAEPDWILWADDVQGLYGEPSEFAALIGTLETHLQAHPEDRDACLVLGIELYLSGRTRQAADVLMRLTDRKPSRVLAAFLDAAQVEVRPAEPAP